MTLWSKVLAFKRYLLCKHLVETFMGLHQKKMSTFKNLEIIWNQLWVQICKGCKCTNISTMLFLSVGDYSLRYVYCSIWYGRPSLCDKFKTFDLSQGSIPLEGTDLVVLNNTSLKKYTVKGWIMTSWITYDLVFF